MQKQAIIQKGYFLTIALTCFFLPLVKIIPSILIVCLLALWIFEFNFKHKWELITTDKWRRIILVLPLLYIVHIIGLIYTKNFSFASLDLQIKLPILIFPLIFSTLEKELFVPQKTRKYMNSFIAGCLLYISICIIHAIFTYFFETKNPSAFYYSRLTWYLHPSYAAIYSTLALAFVYYLLKNGNTKNLKILYYTIMCIFTLFIILAISKAGILALLILACFFIIQIIIGQKKIKLGIAILLALIISFTALYKFSTTASARINDITHALKNINNIDKKSTGSSDSRILVWISSIDVIKENFWFGVGTGDVKDELMKKYHENEMTGVLEQKLNSHNQYLQTFVTLGFIGLLILLSCLYIIFAIGIKNKYPLLTLFAFLISVNFLFESMLEVQSGSMFYGLFSSLLPIIAFIQKYLKEPLSN